MFFGAPQCCGPGSKGAETQRNKEGPHKDAKAQRKYTFAAWRLCEKKKIACEKSKKEKRTKDKKRYGAQRRKEIRRDLTKTRRCKEKTLCGLAPLRAKNKMYRRRKVQACFYALTIRRRRQAW